jgi:elongation factor P
MLSYTDLKKGVLFVRDGKPYEVVESSFSRMQQRKAVVQARIRDLTNGKVVDLTLQPSDYFEEADVAKRPLMFLYRHRDDFVFAEPGKPQQRSTLTKEKVGDAARWLKPNTEITAVFFNDILLTFTVPIKMDLRVTEAPPGIQGDRSQGGTKSVTLETGAVIQAPLFINTDDIIRVNTETGDYVERVDKA